MEDIINRSSLLLLFALFTIFKREEGEKEEEEEGARGKREKERKSYSSGGRPLPPIRRQLFFASFQAALRGTFAYREPCWSKRMYESVTTLSATGHRPLGRGHCPFPAGRIYFVEVVAVACQPSRAEPRTS